MRRLLIVIAAAAALAAGAGAWLLYTEPGLAWALARLEAAAGASLAVQGARGTLAGGARFEQLRYARDATAVEAASVTLSVSPLALLGLTVHIPEFSCERLEIRRGAAPPREGEPPASLGLPLRLVIGRATIGRVTVAGPGEPITATRVAFGYQGSARGHHVTEASLETRGFTLTGEGALGAASPHAVNAAVTARRETDLPVALQARLNGTLQALEVSALATAAGARAQLSGTFAPLEPHRVEHARVEIEALDLRAFAPRLPRTDIAGRLEIARAPAAATLSGTLRLRNAAPGPWDRAQLPVESLAAQVGTDLARVELSELVLALGAAGRLAGRGELDAERIVLDVTARKLDLAGLHSRLRVTALDGPLKLEAGRASQSLSARLAERDVEVAVRAEHRGDVVTVRELRARARGGELRASGRLALSGEQPFSADIELAAFDPSAWGDFPDGSLAGRATASGALARSSAEVEFRLAASRLRDAPLSGGGRVSVRARRLAIAGVELEWGGNRLTASGALGAPGETLTARFDAPHPGRIDERLSGRLAGSARLRGAWPLPAVEFELTVRGLRYAGEASAAAASARGTFDLGADGPLRLDVEASDARLADLALDRLSIALSGTRKAHAVRLGAQGPELDLTAQAHGAWQDRPQWTGTIERLENSGRLPFSLQAPVRVEAAAGRLVLGELAARVAGGRVEMQSLRYESGRFASEGRFTGLRAATALALAGADPAAGGSLELGGEWSVAAAPRWHGTVSVRRESGDVALPADPALPLGLEALDARARMAEDRIAFDGAVRAALLTGRIEGSIAAETTSRGPRIAGGSPLAFEATLEVARLAVLAPAVKSTLQFDGRLRAALTGSGTLGEPLVSGRIEGDDLSIAYPAEGVNLRRGVLRAELAGREVRVRTFSIVGGDGLLSARGTLAAGAGARSTLEWQAERLGIMRRPDRRLTVTGGGRAGLEGGKLSLSGGLRVDEGRIELRQATLPEPGADVVIAGKAPPSPQGARLAATALDLALDLGGQLRIRGRGLDTLLAGEIRIRTAPAGALVASGTVRTERGTYRAFGQRLDLERGRLLFDGPVENPALDIRAMRKMPEVAAGVEVAGTLQSPFVRVVSDPPLPENEALSWLLLGHGPREATAGDLAMIPAAAAALLGQPQPSGDAVARRLGVDSIGLRAGGALGEQFVTVGKRLSDRLYVIYEQSLGATANVLKLEFTLTQRLLLRAETGEVGALGLFYRWAFD